MLDAFGKGASDDMRRAKDMLYSAVRPATPYRPYTHTYHPLI